MGLGKIYYINVIADAGSVGSIIIIAKDTQALADARCGLGDERYKVIWDAVGQLPYMCRGVCTNWVEIPENRTV